MIDVADIQELYRYNQRQGSRRLPCSTHRSVSFSAWPLGVEKHLEIDANALERV